MRNIQDNARPIRGTGSGTLEKDVEDINMICRTDKGDVIGIRYGRAKKGGRRRGDVTNREPVLAGGFDVIGASGAVGQGEGNVIGARWFQKSSGSVSKCHHGTTGSSRWTTGWRRIARSWQGLDGRGDGAH